MQCPSCSKRIEEGVPYCAYCGALVSALRKSVFSGRVLVGIGLALVLLLGGGTIVALAVTLSTSASPAATRTAIALAPLMSPTPVVLASPTDTPIPATPEASAASPSPEPTAPVSAPASMTATQSLPVAASAGPTKPLPAATPAVVVIVVTSTWTPSPTSSRTPTALPTRTPSLTPTRQFFPLRLSSPTNGESFKDELIGPFLEWKAATDGALEPDEWYRIQVYHSNDRLQCNLYTKMLFFQLPASGQPPCDPATWKFNTGDYVWRISFVIKVDGDVNHDIEKINSEGRLFKWNK